MDSIILILFRNWVCLETIWLIASQNSITNHQPNKIKYIFYLQKIPKPKGKITSTFSVWQFQRTGIFLKPRGYQGSLRMSLGKKLENRFKNNKIYSQLLKIYLDKNFKGNRTLSKIRQEPFYDYIITYFAL